MLGTIIDIEQNSPEWYAVRRGIPTASNFCRIITAAKGEISKQSVEYMDELIAECFFDEACAKPNSPWMERGHEAEPLARKCFEDLTGLNLRQVGFVKHPAGFGCSPDALVVDADGNYIAGLELKCPTPKIHVKYHRQGVLPPEYKQQVHGSMVVTGLDRWYFMSYAPGVQPFLLCIERDEYTQTLESGLLVFMGAYQVAHASLCAKLMLPEDSESSTLALIS